MTDSVKTWNGIAVASVKTYDGIAKASVKSINGVSLTPVDPYWANVVLLLGNNNAANGTTTLTDQSTAENTVTNTSNNATYSTTSPPTGMTSSINFNGSSSFVRLDGSSDFTFGTGDFTIEYYFTTSSFAAAAAQYDGRPASTNGFYVGIYFNTDGKIYMETNGGTRISGSTVMSTNTWYHVAYSRGSSSGKLFLNGTQEGSTYSDSNDYLGAASRPAIGANAFTSTGSLTGKICSMRVTKGVSRYSSNFTPPTLPMPTQ